MGFWNKTRKLITGTEPKPRASRRKLTKRDLIRMESRIGSQLFGHVPAGHRREFFYLDNNTWVWYEEWIDQVGKRRELTTRYEIHPTGILKVQDGQPYAVVEGDELQNLFLAIRMYYDRASRDIYKRDPSTLQSLLA